MTSVATGVRPLGARVILLLCLVLSHHDIGHGYDVKARNQHQCLLYGEQRERQALNIFFNIKLTKKGCKLV